jgi:predicted Ser/Thr protein kinase
VPIRRMHPPIHNHAADPTEAVGGLAAIDMVRQRAALALFGAPPAPTRVGRFQVHRLLGAGGMGVVFAANDPQLGRTVALKLLQPMTSGELARERLKREAQAMARLQHPNVVGVYEVGVHGDQVFVAMEYVEGGTLADWLKVRPRGWKEVVEMLCQAGDGLAAAHAVGLVHRDFKPANILMSGTRARISDFGLARAAADASELERTSEDDGLLLASPLTRTGALIGTPAYMAPELLRGEPATPASDQFAFGVVLFEALHGQRPFLGDSVPALLNAIEAGTLSRPARKELPPPSVSAVIRRALAPDPAQRFPDMPTLLTTLRDAKPCATPSVRAMGAMTMAVTLLAGLGLLANSEAEPDVAATPETVEVQTLDESAMRALAMLVPDQTEAESRYGDKLRCSDDATDCEIDRELAARLAAVPVLEFSDRARVMPSVKDGIALGAKIYGIKPGSTLSILGFKNGDMFTAVGDGAFEPSDCVPALQRLLLTGGTVWFERKGQAIERRYTVR